jgi:hypothetical protein
MLRYGLPFVPHHVQAVLLSDLFGKYVIRENLGLGDVGLYDVAAKFATPVLFVVTAVQTSWVAHKFQVHAEDEDSPSFFRSTFTYYCAGLFYLWLGVSVWGPELLRVLASSQFDAGATLIPVIALIPVAQGLYYMLGTGMELTDDTKAYPLISLSGLITVAIASFAMVSAWGAYGAATATASGWLVMAITAYILAQRRFRIEYDWPAVASISGLAIVIVAGSLAIQNQSAPVRVLVALVASIVYPAIVYLFLRRSPSERERMQILWRVVGRRFSFLRRFRSQSTATLVCHAGFRLVALPDVASLALSDCQDDQRFRRGAGHPCLCDGLRAPAIRYQGAQRHQRDRYGTRRARDRLRAWRNYLLSGRGWRSPGVRHRLEYRASRLCPPIRRRNGPAARPKRQSPSQLFGDERHPVGVSGGFV